MKYLDQGHQKVGHNLFMSKILSLLVRGVSSGPHAPPVFTILQRLVCSGDHVTSMRLVWAIVHVARTAIHAFLLRD